MKRYVLVIAPMLLCMNLISGCSTAPTNTTAKKTTENATLPRITTTTAKAQTLISKPDHYIASPDWISNQLVYVVGWNKRTNPTNALFVSRNSGKTWAKVPTPLGNQVEQVHFQTPVTGIIYGTSHQQFNPLAIYRTKDGGLNWIKQSVPTNLSQGALKYGPPDVTFVTLHHKLTWLMATWNDNQFPRHALYHSDNNGLTWSYSSNNPTVQAEGYLSNFHAPDEQTAYFTSYCAQCGISGETQMTGTNTLEITKDAGHSWTKIALPFTGEQQVKHLVFTGNQHGKAIVSNAMTGRITNYVTSDGGHHWTKQSSY